jgi:hypothetical protein|nr:MAG TPA: hypothetical protein [Caudoviricetes sp.]
MQRTRLLLDTDDEIGLLSRSTLEQVLSGYYSDFNDTLSLIEEDAIDITITLKRLYQLFSSSLEQKDLRFLTIEYTSVFPHDDFINYVITLESDFTIRFTIHDGELISVRLKDRLVELYFFRVSQRDWISNTHSPNSQDILYFLLQHYIVTQAIRRGLVRAPAYDTTVLIKEIDELFDNIKNVYPEESEDYIDFIGNHLKICMVHRGDMKIKIEYDTHEYRITDPTIVDKSVSQNNLIEIGCKEVPFGHASNLYISNNDNRVLVYDDDEVVDLVYKIFLVDDDDNYAMLSKHRVSPELCEVMASNVDTILFKAITGFTINPYFTFRSCTRHTRIN